MTIRTSILGCMAAFFTFISTPVRADYPRPWQWDFQEAASPVMERLVAFHDSILVWEMVGISVLVLVLLGYVCIRFSAKNNPQPSKTSHNTLIEIIWTAVPVLILLIIVVPSLRVLYFMDTAEDAEMTLKVTGYQWYWGYEYPDQGDIAFESYMKADDEIQEGEFRLLETDNRVVLPVDTTIRVLVTAADVIHSWAMPAFGIKTDAVPGRVNETWVRIEKPGVYYGQCSELCGKDHGFMPIAVEAVSKDAFAAWVAAQNGETPAVSAEETALLVQENN